MKTSAAIALTLAGFATANPIVRSSKWKRAGLQGLDFEIINLARNLESLELNYWNQGLKNFTDEDFNNAGYQGFRTYLELFRDQEIAHFTVLNEAAGEGFENCTYTFPVNTPYDLLAVGQVITTVGEGAFIGGVANLTDSPSRQTGAEIIGNEARQNSLLRQFLGLDYFNAVNFDTPLTASQAYSLAKPFLNCPSSNPPIKFHSIPPLTANFTSGSTPHNAGDEITVNWDSSKVYLGQDVHITFLADMYSIPAPLTQSGNDGQGTVNLPKGINGTSIIVATNFNGGGPIPDEQNFAIGYVVVA
ncbi:uncharacterized protein L201_001281 [Kwoniella dendrophila CBS 6074]|uniref:Rds1p n=1 Tax=Kwoniella dendrophila CBS 6074 TaxID=1295534 RepID=A0AAX4JPC4_9TREE